MGETPVKSCNTQLFLGQLRIVSVSLLRFPALLLLGGIVLPIALTYIMLAGSRA